MVFYSISEYTANSGKYKSWMEKITSIKVNDAEPYTKVDNTFFMKEDTFRANVNMLRTIGNKEFTKDTNKVVILKDIDLVLEVGKDYKKLPYTQTIQAGTATVRRKQSANSVRRVR